MDSPPADQGEQHQDDQGPVPLASDLIEVLAAVLGRRENKVGENCPLEDGTVAG
jgi:hypothetical protein